MRELFKGCFKWVPVDKTTATLIPGLQFMLLFAIGNWGIALVKKDGAKK